MSLYHWLLFRSTASVSPWPSTILDIVRVTERNNSASGVTGMLVFSATGYLQYLEGPHLEGLRPAIDATWARIAQDPRHRVVWSVRGTADAPRLPGLPLGYFDADRESSAIQRDPLWDHRRDWHDRDAAALAAMLERIAHEKYPATLSRGGAPGPGTGAD